MNLRTSRTIVINGWYGHFNAGDDAILEVFVNQATSRMNCNIVVLSEVPENIQQTSHVHSSYHLPFSLGSAVRALLNGELIRHLRHLRQCDLFVLGGGGLLRDNTSWRNLLRLLDEIWFSKLFGRKVMLYAIGVGPFKSRLGKYLIGKTVKMCDLITVRSAHGAQLLRELGVPAERIHVVADPAFLLQQEVPQDPSLAQRLQGKIGVFPALGLLRDGHDFTHVKQLAAALDELFEKQGRQFIALPMRVRDKGMDDVELSHAIKAAMKHPEAMDIYERRLAPSELKWATGQTLMNITVRLHAMIFSLGSRAPVVAINYEPKVRNVFAAMKCPEYLVEMDNDLDKNLVSTVEHCLDNLPAYSQKIADVMADYEKSALHTFDLMQSLDLKLQK